MWSNDKRPGRGAVQKIINYIQHDKGYAEKYVGVVSRLIYQFLIELGNYSGRQKKPGRDEQDVTSRQGSFCAYRFYAKQRKEKKTKKKRIYLFQQDFS